MTLDKHHQHAIEKADVLIEALGWIRRFRDKVTVIKLGGSVMEDPNALRHLLVDIVFMESVGMRPVVVHGGGAAISRAMDSAGLVPRFIQGRRYTDDATLKIVEQVLAYETCEQIAKQIEDFGGRAMPLNFRTTNVLFGEKITLKNPTSSPSLPAGKSPGVHVAASLRDAPGATGSASAAPVVRGSSDPAPEIAVVHGSPDPAPEIAVVHGSPDPAPAEIDLGHVGRVTRVDRTTIENLCYAGQVPVIPSMCLAADGGKLNVNADTSATAVATALGAEKLIFLSDVNGVRMKKDDPNTLIHSLTATQARELIREGAIESGMIPKVEGCLETLDKGVRKIHIIDGRLRHSLLLEIYTNRGVGTEMLRDD
ncbi:MAG TPA: acetylglutamate kinase [Pirellulales bacterium]